VSGAALADAPVVLRRIAEALERSMAALARIPRPASAEEKLGGRGPVTEADRAVDALLRDLLPRDGEGWLSEETRDATDRLACRRVWIVDPIDGTREYVDGVPEWAISIGLVEDGRAVAGGVANPATGEVFLGAAGLGVTVNGRPARVPDRRALDGALVLASRSETARGEWDDCRGRAYTVKSVGSVAYKLALVAAGAADATWTRVPKSEWDVAGGVALVLAAGGDVRTPDGERPRFNRETPTLPGLCACSAALAGALRREWASAG